MAHYASDCWDAEIETSYGWIEIAGHADRSCFDLDMHSKATKVDLVASRPLENPYQKDFIVVTIDKKTLGMKFKKDSNLINKYVEEATEEQKAALHTQWETEGTTVLRIEVQDKEELKSFEIEKSLFKFEKQTKMIMEEKFCPNVIEPSFGIGRVLYCIFEHCFKVREDDD